MARNSRSPRRLAVDGRDHLWAVRHEHRDGADRGCREVLAVRRDGDPGRLLIVFEGGPGRLLPDGYLHSGAVGTAGARCSTCTGPVPSGHWSTRRCAAGGAAVRAPSGSTAGRCSTPWPAGRKARSPPRDESALPGARAVPSSPRLSSMIVALRPYRRAPREPRRQGRRPGTGFPR
ncbi:hypothetical protein ACFQXA_10885 [Nocardiopsis composta]